MAGEETQRIERAAARAAERVLEKKPGLLGAIKDHAVPIIITAGLGLLGTLLWSGGMAYLDTRHVQRHELIEWRILDNNRAIREKRHYNEADDPDGRFKSARSNVIADLEDENEMLKRQLERSKE